MTFDRHRGLESDTRRPVSACGAFRCCWEREDQPSSWRAMTSKLKVTIELHT
jgi:hypothetical protein